MKMSLLRIAAMSIDCFLLSLRGVVSRVVNGKVLSQLAVQI